jgi:hypothetical protein
VVHLPAITAVLLRGQRDLPRDQNPPLSSPILKLVSSEQPRMLLEQALQDLFGLIRRLGHLDQLITTPKKDATASHADSNASRSTSSGSTGADAEPSVQAHPPLSATRAGPWPARGARVQAVGGVASALDDDHSCRVDEVVLSLRPAEAAVRRRCVDTLGRRPRRQRRTERVRTCLSRWLLHKHAQNSCARTGGTMT